MKIYVGNLNYQTTEPELRKSFEEFGEINSLDIIIDKQSGKSKGFGFVEMEPNDNAQKAITGMHGKELAGNVLRVNEAKKK